jgi:glucosyl-dolichyl phosphate glucuronosyltransferase
VLTVIIATKDRAALLASTLNALIRQEDPGEPVEILVVDNGSVDETPAVVRDAAARATAPVIYLREDRPGKSHALNTAVAHARGDVIVLTDDDVLPGERWLREYLRAFAETDADYAAGRIVPLWERTPPAWMSPALHGVLSIPDGGSRRLPLGHGSAIMPIGCNMAVRRHVIDHVGGWDPDLGKLEGTLRTGEDHDFALRLTAAGYSGVYVPEAVVQHRVPADRLRQAYIRRWFFENGAIVAGLERRYPSTNSYLLNVPRYLWKRALRDAWTAVTATVRGDVKRAVAGTMRLTWFSGYLRARWS